MPVSVKLVPLHSSTCYVILVKVVLTLTLCDDAKCLHIHILTNILMQIPPRNLPTQYKEAAVSAASERKRYRSSRDIAIEMGLLERRIIEEILH